MATKILKIFILFVSLALLPGRMFAQCYDTPADRMQGAPHMLNSVTEELEWVVGVNLSDYNLSINLENKIREQELEKARARQRTGVTIEEAPSRRGGRVANDMSKIGLRIKTNSNNYEIWKANQDRINAELERRRREQEKAAKQDAVKYKALENKMTRMFLDRVAENTNMQNIRTVEEAAVAFENCMKTGNVFKEASADNKNDLNHGMQPASPRPLRQLLKILEKTDSTSDFSDAEKSIVNAFFNSITLITE